MDVTDWLARWQQNNIGWHEQGGNANLRKFWPTPSGSRRVLVPLCGKSEDLRWLLDQGHDVTGVEVSELAIETFFREQAIDYIVTETGGLRCYVATEMPLAIYCCDYFDFTETGFDALYDRAALVALPPDTRKGYARHTAARLKPAAALLVLTLTYDQSRVQGPPFSVTPDEVRAYWPGIELVASCNDIQNCSDKFHEAGVEEAIESVWRRPA